MNVLCMCAHTYTFIIHFTLVADKTWDFGEGKHEVPEVLLNS